MKARTYTLWTKIGTAKYLVSYFTGNRFNPDGSLAEDIKIFSNKREANGWLKKTLIRAGYSTTNSDNF